MSSYCTGTTKDKILEVLQWGETGLTSISLKECVNLRKIASPTANSFANITDFGSTFYDCTSLTNIPADLFANCQNVTDFRYAFSGCTTLTSIPTNLFAKCQNVTDFIGTFYGCKKLTGDAPDIWIRVLDGKTNGYIGTPDGCGCFAECTNLTNYEQIPSYWRASDS